MLKRQSSLTMLSCLCVATAGVMSVAQADDNANSNIDHVLNELSRQHNNASSIVQANRQPLSLANNSQLLAKSKDTSTATRDGDVLERLSAVASNSVNKFQQNGMASWYGRQFNGHKTASGEIYNQNSLTAAHRSLPLNCYIKVTNKSNGKSVVVKVNDRGPFHGSRVLDLSYAAANKIGIANTGTGNVSIERVTGPN